MHKKIEQYLEDLSKPQAKLNGFAACPWIQPYRASIHIYIAEQGIKEPVLEAITTHITHRHKATIVAFPKKPAHGTLKKVCDDILEEYPDLEILLVNHKLTGPYRGIDTSFTHCDLAIIQNSRLLNHARATLKSRGYYQKNI